MLIIAIQAWREELGVASTCLAYASYLQLLALLQEVRSSVLL